jgi:hypothetical protein
VSLHFWYLISLIGANVSHLQSSRGAGPSSNIPPISELDSKSKGPLPIHNLDRIDSAESAQSEDSDRSEDLPPPYKV